MTAASSALSSSGGGEGVFVLKGEGNMTFNVGAAAGSATVGNGIGIVASTAYAAGTAIFLDANDGYLPKLAPYGEAGSIIAGTPNILAKPDIVIGYTSRRIDAAEFVTAGVTVDIPVYFCGIWPGYDRVGYI